MPKNLRRHGAGWQTYVRIKGQLVTKSWPASTDLDRMKRWVHVQKATRQPAAAGTLEADIQRYIRQHLAQTPNRATRLGHLERWARYLGGHTPRWRITTTAIEAAMTRMAQEERLSPQTIRHHRTSLVALYRALDGAHAENAAAEARAPRPPRPQPRGLPYTLIVPILESMRPSATRARLKVLAYTGLPHAQIMRLTPDDLHLADAEPWLRASPRRKGEGASGRQQPLTPQAVEALREFIREEAWGPFSPSSLYAAWARACARWVRCLSCGRVERRGPDLPARCCDQPWAALPRVRPYDLRHSWGAEIYRATRDLATVARLLGLSDLRMAARYAQTADDETDRAAIAKVSQALPAPVPIRGNP